MKYQNPVIRGFYPDPSVCYANGKFYLVTSSFQYFPGVPLFESEDLVNWNQIGHVLTRKTQVMLDKVRSSGGVFAPTIRYNNGRFYMVTNNNSTNKNFYVYTDDIYGEWSDPIEVDQNGIDPSLYFEDGRVYFVSNGHDDDGVNGVVQCEINIETGEKISKSKCIWQGSGGRYLESPHVYKIGEYYYAMVAEGGTEYGHMITYARSKSIWGPYEDYPNNPVLTNRNKAPYLIQAIGHGDLIQNESGDWYMLSLGFRQIDTWMPFHHLGREVYLTPAQFDEDGWFTVGKDGTTDEEYEIPGNFTQMRKNLFTFDNTNWDIDWCYMRYMHPENYILSDEKVVLTGTDITLDDVDSPTFIGLRQIDFDMECTSDVTLSAASSGEAGITLYMCENEHYEVAIQKRNDDFYGILRLNIGGIKHIENDIKLTSDSATLTVRSDSLNYKFYISENGVETYLGTGKTKYLSSEVSEGFTGTITALYAVGDCEAAFTGFACRYN